MTAGAQTPAANRVHGDAGSVSTEMVIVTPIAIALLCLVALVGRTTSAREAVDSAARDAARAASIERDPNAATVAATQAASSSLASSGHRCVSYDVSVDVGSYGPGGKVTVTVTCEIPLGDLGPIGLGGTKAITASAVEVVDTYKAVS